MADIVTDLTPIPSVTLPFILSGVDAINAALYNLFMTIPGTRPFFPTYGIGIERWLGQTFDLVFVTYCRQVIRNQIATWEPRISVNNVTVTFIYAIKTLVVEVHYVIIVKNINVPGKFSLELETN